MHVVKLFQIFTVGLLLAVPYASAQERDVAAPNVFEPSPVLDAARILRPGYDSGPYFRVRPPVPTHGGLNGFKIDSTFGDFRADGNLLLMRRVAEINAIAVLKSISRTEEFKQAAARAAKSPLIAAKELVSNPVGTVSGVPKGLWKLLNSTGQSIKEIGQKRGSDPAEGKLAENLLGLSKVKRQISLQLGVDPYSSNQEYQKALTEVAWPVFAGGMTVNIGLAVATSGIGNAGLALSAVSWTGSLNDILRENSPADLRLMNLGVLLKMGVPRPDAVAFLNNTALSPTVQTILVSKLRELGQASGRVAYIRRATKSSDERDAFFFAQCAQLMAKVNAVSPIRQIFFIGEIPVCQSAAGVVVVPIQWDYVAWTPMAKKFADKVKAHKFSEPPTGYQLVLTGVVSPMAAERLAGMGIAVYQKQLPNPLR
jgi:hypothetical protein